VPTRSTLIRAGVLLTGVTSQIIRCPDATTLLIKSIYGYASASVAGDIYAHIQLAPAPAVTTIALAVAPNAGYRWDGWLALTPGWAVLLANVTNAQISYAISGTHLPGVAPVVPATKPT
jgi:hypothetical protein